MQETVFKRNEHCTRCGSPVVVRYRGNQTATPSPSTETIVCPWGGHNWTLEIPGPLLWVEKRQYQQPGARRRELQSYPPCGAAPLRLWDEIANSEWRAINCNQLQTEPTLC